MAWLLRGMENLLMDFLADPDLAHAICEKLTDLRVRQAVRYAELGVDILRLGDDVGTQTGPMIGLETYRTFLKERTRRIIRSVKPIKIAMNPHLTDPQQTETPSSRQRFLDTLKFKPVAKPWLRWGAFLWEETIERWKQEGWDGTPLDDLFELDRLVRVDPWYGPVPEFRHEVLSEDAETVTYVNHEGIVMREFKQHHDASMPQFIKFPVESEGEFERFAAERLALNAGQRLSAEWQAMVASGRVQATVGRGDLHEDEQLAAAHKPAREEWPRKCWADRWGGFFGSLRNLMGVQNLCMAFYDQPRSDRAHDGGACRADH